MQQLKDVVVSRLTGDPLVRSAFQRAERDLIKCRELSAQEKMALAQANLAKWLEVAASPNLSPKAAAWARDAARSFQAEVTLRHKAQAHQKKIDSEGCKPSDATSLMSSATFYLFRDIVVGISFRPVPRLSSARLGYRRSVAEFIRAKATRGR